MIYMRAKFELYSLNRSRDMKGTQNSKSRSCDPFTTCKQGAAGDPIFGFLVPDLPIHYTTFMGYNED